MVDTFISLWPSEREARAPSQTGASNCGQTSVITSLMALKINEDPCGEVTVRARNYGTRSLTAYLKSRALAGCTGADLVTGAASLSGGQAEAKFFATGTEPPEGLVDFLADFISAGAAPVVTINTQLDGADYWHHQAVLGVRRGSRTITLANPVETVSEAEVARLLGSASVMLVMASDVLQRCPPPAEEIELLRAPQWAKFDVVGQVEKLMKMTAHDSHSHRIAIPASYVPGVTMIAPAGSGAARKVREATSPWSDSQHDLESWNK